MSVLSLHNRGRGNDAARPGPKRSKRSAMVGKLSKPRVSSEASIKRNKEYRECNWRRRLDEDRGYIKRHAVERLAAAVVMLMAARILLLSTCTYTTALTATSPLQTLCICTGSTTF